MSERPLPVHTAGTASPRPDLRLDWCSHAAAEFAVKRWHYSRSMPVPPIVKIGVWEAGKFVGCVMFSRGATPNLLKPYGLLQTEGCELTRIALGQHAASVSRVAAIAMRLLRSTNPGLRLIVSFADPNHGHQGAIYQAGNWLYAGQTEPSVEYLDRSGNQWHGRQVSVIGYKRQFGTRRRTPKIADCQRVPCAGKHRYLMPLDEAMRARIAPLAQPYPKRVKQATNGHHPRGGGAEPTHTLPFTGQAATLDTDGRSFAELQADRIGQHG